MQVLQAGSAMDISEGSGVLSWNTPFYLTMPQKGMMKYRGINYDTGNNYRAGTSSRPLFDPVLIKKEIGIIRSELHCDAIRISGCDIDRLVTASRFAREFGLTVFFSPQNINASVEETERFILESAGAAELLRAEFGEVIFVAGCELSFFSRGFVGGDTTDARLGRVFSPVSIILNAAGIPRRYNWRLNEFFRKIMPGIRERFHGEVTYASGTWEHVDWDLFDLVGIDHYRSAWNRATYRDELKRFFRSDKPVVVLEFGCCCYRGADEKGGAGWMIVDRERERPSLKGDFVRDESVQAGYLEELLHIFTEEHVAGAFVFTFVQPAYVHRADPRYDIDMASYGIVAMLEEGSDRPYRAMPWIPKKAFSTIADLYSRPE